MKHFAKSLLLGLALLLGIAIPVAGQTVACGSATCAATTTLSAAISDSKTRTITVASATGISAPSLPISGGGFAQPTSTILFIDREAMQVTGVSGTTISVSRGRESTSASPHASGAVVFILPRNLLLNIGGGMVDGAPSFPGGSCTRSSELVLPRIQLTTGLFSDCVGGQWVNGDATQTTRQTYNGLRLPDPGSNALTSLETAGTAPAANTEIYCTELDMPFSMLVTGLGVLNGTTVGTDKHWVILYDSSGNVLANSATAGATTSGASTYQKFNFVNKYYVVGPARYFGCVGSNGTTDTIRHAITSVNDNILGGTVTGQVFGTAAAITVPSSFTTAKVPYLLVF
jgi:hypothetical protein